LDSTPADAAAHSPKAGPPMVALLKTQTGTRKRNNT